ncbi:Tuberous sclerosis 2 protein like protein [Daldinia childiae]|uniref:Tuberous sclerosis 2 protein like protein n=1 Tax=Daldinia childiae TaxID=326645 RepID=UPI001446E903|nr:Tuberous sclerosis 2 protein like protein [Daldinia childiae]KAF3069080.1 Tuberous sclerosis 2 protein like protein [Daldinia childiae]
MFRRIAFLGRKAGEERQTEEMSPSPGDDGSSPQDTKGSSGLASVFKGLAGAAKLTKSPPAPVQSSGPSISVQIAERLSATPNILRGIPSQHAESFELLKNGSMTQRVAAADALRHTVADYPLSPVLDIWYAAKDLVDPTNPKTVRYSGWELLRECVKHTSSTDLERNEYFQTISAEANPEDFHLQLAALVDLTNHARNLSGFDYDVFPLLSRWLEEAFEAVRAARGAAKKQGSRMKGKALVTGEDRNFTDLFSFITDVIKFNFNVADDDAAEVLIEKLLDICMNTSVEEDLQACIGIMDAIVTFGAIPADKLKSCVHVLCSIHCLVPSLQKDAWHTMSMLCRSHNGHTTVRLLLDVLASLPENADKKKEVVREVRGALSVLTKLVSKSSEKGYPAVPYALLVDGLSTVVHATSAWKIHLDILRLTNSLFCDSQGNINNMLADEDWTPVFDVAVICAGVVVESLTKPENPIESLLAPEENDSAESMLARELMKLIRRLESILLDEFPAITQKQEGASLDQGDTDSQKLEAIQPEQPNTLIQRQDCILFFTKIHRALPDSGAILVLEYFKKFRCCSPSDPLWETNLSLVLDAFLADRKRSTDVRLRALQAFTEVYDMIELINDQFEPDFIPELVKRLLADVAGEADIILLQEIVSFAVGVASTAPFSLFSYVIDTLRGIVGNNRLRSISSSLSLPPEQTSTPQHIKSAVNQTPSNVVVRGYVQIFLRVLNYDATKSVRLFHVLVSIAELNSSETDARITAMQLLFRLRADWANRIFVTAHTETNSLATSLYRTEESMTRKLAEEASYTGRNSRSEAAGSARSSRGISLGHGQMQDRGYPLRSGSGSKMATSAYQPLWIASDTDALPEAPSQAASMVLYCSTSDDTAEVDGLSQVKVLETRIWLEVILNLVRQSCDWEVYSFILVHLPSQLSNHAIFQNATVELQELRRVICEQIKMNNFQEPPSVFGLRRADVAICLFHTLTMILSYHQYFQKAEEDEIVRTFVHGIATWERSAKCCIHALTICCHELPSSTGKALVTILQKMAQIITQPYVAMHILEFLACLSRLPSLYANFREDEYRIVFGICFRYLQYVRGRKQAYRISSISDSSIAAASEGQFNPNTSDDLPQYVYTLAYHVIVFWFLALKLPDRTNHVGWIARNLFIDVDGPQASDEQAHLTMDFIQRVTYADVDESAADPLFTSDRFGEILKKRWLIGNSIVTIEQATATGWAQITKRQPSGTSSYTIRELFRPPPAHQRPISESLRDSHTGIISSILPNHLLVQLLSSMPQGNDLSRPVPLPDDDVVNRAIRMFDHNSTVDGHKVGVVYIGENQTHETEILSNISGSGDYVEFLNGLGTLTKLHGATFNTQGLDRQYDTDGQYTFCWRDRVTEIVFHVTTQMPTNLDHDPQCTLKKRHIGNDFVNIIFNDSGLPFKFDTFPSEFNFVNIVITPESRASFVATRQRTPKDVAESYYKVRVMSKPGFPEISPASETKIVSLRALPDFIRLLALNASVFSLVWAHREGGEHVSAWRNRLREIKRLRDKYGPKASVVPHQGHGGPSPSPPGTALGHGHGNTTSLGSTTAAQLEAARSGSTVRDSFSSLRRSSVATFFSASSEQNSHRSSMLSTATTDNTEVMTANGVDALVDSVDFSKWSA